MHTAHLLQIELMNICQFHVIPLLLKHESLLHLSFPLLSFLRNRRNTYLLLRRAYRPYRIAKHSKIPCDQPLACTSQTVQSASARKEDRDIESPTGAKFACRHREYLALSTIVLRP